ncbi:MAG: DNA gyrase subunit A, partial [Candidatus Anstonellales archaeon]
MKETIPCLYAEYGRYINRFRAIPYYIDALKPVERRLLISLYHTARSDFTKSAKVIGHCIANYHPHGDQSAYESLVGLVHRGFAIGQGNWGSKYGLNEIPPAAMRYTRVKLSDSIRSLFEELLYYVKYEEFEMESEPIFLPSPIPLGLIGDNVITGISFYSTKIPQYDFKDLIERLKYILGIRDEVVIRPNFKDCMIEDVRNGIKKILSKGEGTIRLIPKYEIESKNLIIIGKPRIYGFSRLIRVCDNMRLPIIDNSKTKHGTRIIIEGGASSEDIVKKIIDSVSYEIKFSCYFVDDTGNASIFGIDDILKKCIDSYKDATMNYLKDQLHILKEKKEDIKIIK